MIDSEPEAPKVFISYSWDDEEHRQWVQGFATRLRADGVDVELDRWRVGLGDPLPEFMERAVRGNDYVLVVCTPHYKERSDSRVGGVGYEGDIMAAEVLSERNNSKFVPVLRKGNWRSALPSWLLGKAGVDLRGARYSEEEYERLVDALHGRVPQAPPLGQWLNGISRTAAPEISPGIRPGQLPPFHELDEYIFQDLCRDLFDAEPSVATCEVYGKRGQAQHGIDLLAYRAEGDGIEVGQCKCYERFTPAQIAEVTREFFQHYGEWWRHRNVKRFILFVAGDLTSTQHQNKILEERNRFAAFGIRYEVWSAAQLRNKLRPRPDIVSTYLQPAEHWVRVICGTRLPAPYPASALQPQAAAIVNAALVERLERRESEEAERRLEEMRAAWREGRQREAVVLLDNVKADTATWQTISPETKAKLLRFEAGARLHISGNINLAKRLADEAHALAPSEDESRVRTLITRAEAGPGMAAELLADRRDADAVNLRASLLLEQGDVEGFRQALQGLPEELLEPNAESAQLRALLHLLDKEMDRARLEAQKALEAQPRWESVRFTAAVVDYMSALSPPAVPDYLVGWPEPVDWSLIKGDDESLARLRSAADTFRELSEEVDDQEDRQRYETWVLACLANDPEAQEEAMSYGGGLLEAEPSNHHAILWAVARSFDLDLAPSESRLRGMVDDGSAEIPHVLVLGALLIANRRSEEAAEVLEATRPMFDAGHAASLWTSWYAQALALGGDPRGALQQLDTSDAGGEMRRVRTVVLAVQAEQTGDWDPVIQHLERSYEVTRDPAFMLDACELKERQEDWTYVAAKAEQLVEELGTADSLRLAALGTYNDGKFELCLRLLDDRRDVLPGGRLPRELRQVRLACQYRLGFLPEAVKNAEEIAREDPTVANLLNLLLVCVDAGDRPRMVRTARDLRDHPDLTDVQALEVSEVVRLDDRNLAIGLWRKATWTNLPDRLVPLALTLGFRLGLDDELQQLGRRAMELAQRSDSGLRAPSPQEVLQIMEQQYERTVAVEQIYLDGVAPIHLMSEVMSGSLAYHYHRKLLDNEAMGLPAAAPLLLIEHGGRGYLKEPHGSQVEGRPVLDVTAVLLAEHLGLLNKVEQVYEEIGVPWELMRALMRLRDRVYPQQPARQEALENIIELADEGNLQSEEPSLPDQYENTSLLAEMGEQWVAAFERARACEGYLVDTLPLTRKIDLTGPPAALPEGASEYVVNSGLVLQALRIHGPLSETRAIELAEALGEEGYQHPGQPIPETGSYLFLDGGMAETLASLNVLGTVCERFRVHLGASELSRIRDERRVLERGIQDADWLAGLMDRVRRGLENGKYRTVVAPTGSAAGSMIDSDDPSVLCLDTLLRFEPQQGDVIWVDDRAVNKYQASNGVPMVGVYDILRGLYTSEVLGEDVYYSSLVTLRASNARFIPLEGKEILYHLRQARVENSIVVETRELSVLRRYMAACLLGGEILRRPTTQDNVVVDVGEMPFLMQMIRAVAEALTGVWDGEQDETVARARAEWLLANLYLGYAGLSNVVTMAGSGGDERPKVASDLKDLIIRAVARTTSADPAHQALRQRLHWLEGRVLLRRFDADPLLLAMTASEVRDSIMNVRQELSRQAPEPLISLSLQPYYENLPESVRDELAHDPDFMAAVGRKVVVVMQVGPFRFSSDEYWRAATEAINGRPASVNTIDDEPTTIFLSSTENPNVLRLGGAAIGETGEQPTVAGHFYPLLSESVAARERALRDNRAWFDCPEDEFEGTVAEIASLTDPLNRVREAELWRDSSTAIFYEDLSVKLAEQAPVYFEEMLPPSAERLLSHLRLRSETGRGELFREAAEEAARQLVREEGLIEALHRFGALPIPLPMSLLETVDELPASDQRDLIEQLSTTLAGSPISKVHLIHLLMHLSEDEAYARRARHIHDSLLSDRGAEEYEAYSVVLRWVNDEFDRKPDLSSLPPHLRLAAVWYHAHRLFAICTSLGIPYHHTRNSFDNPDTGITSEVFERDAEYWQDVCHPRRLDRVVFLHMGLAYAFDDATEHLDVAALRRTGGDHHFVMLLRDPVLARDGLQSFLARDRGEALARLMDQQEAGAISSASLRERLSEAIEHLTEGPLQGDAWTLLFFILDDQPPPEELREPLKNTILSSNIVGFVQEDTPTGLFALRTASLQTFNLEDENLRSHLKEQLLLSAKHVADEKRREGVTEIDVSAPDEQGELRQLVEAAVNLSAAIKGEGAYADFADMLSRLTDTWSAVSPWCKLVALGLCEKLEPQKARPFWRVLVRSRAQ